MSEDSVLISYSDAHGHALDSAKLLCEATLAVALVAPPPTVLASHTDYLTCGCEPGTVQLSCARDIISRTHDAKLMLAQEIEKIKEQMHERDYRNAEIFLRDMPTEIFRDEIEVDTYKYLTIGWELARFRNVSVSFSSERIHVVGQHRMEEVAQSFLSSEMDCVYDLIRKILYV